MSYGPVSYSEFATSDIVAPGAPTFIAVSQTNNLTIKATVAIPTQDATGGPLTGLSELTVATMPMSGGQNPFIGLSMDEILALPGISIVTVALVEAEAGTQVEVILPVVNLGGFQAIAAACSD